MMLRGADLTIFGGLQGSDAFVFNINGLRFTKTQALPEKGTHFKGLFVGEKQETAENASLEDVGAAPSPEDLSGFACAGFGDRAFLIGGDDARPIALSFDFKAKAWNALKAPTRGLNGGGLVALDGRLFLAGGQSGDQTNRSVEVYDPQANSWSTLIEDHGLAVSEVRVFALNKRLLIGGFREGPGGDRSGENILSFAVIDTDLEALKAPTPVKKEAEKKDAEAPAEKKER